MFLKIANPNSNPDFVNFFNLPANLGCCKQITNCITEFKDIKYGNTVAYIRFYSAKQKNYVVLPVGSYTTAEELKRNLTSVIVAEGYMDSPSMITSQQSVVIYNTPSNNTYNIVFYGEAQVTTLFDNSMSVVSSGVTTCDATVQVCDIELLLQLNDPNLQVPVEQVFTLTNAETAIASVNLSSNLLPNCDSATIVEDLKSLLTPIVSLLSGAVVTVKVKNCKATVTITYTTDNYTFSLNNSPVLNTNCRDKVISVSDILYDFNNPTPVEPVDNCPNSVSSTTDNGLFAVLVPRINRLPQCIVLQMIVVNEDGVEVSNNILGGFADADDATDAANNYIVDSNIQFNRGDKVYLYPYIKCGACPDIINLADFTPGNDSCLAYIEDIPVKK